MIDKEIIKIASNTENHGVLNNHTHSSKLKTPICGDVMKINIMVDEDGVIIESKFKTFGCGSAIASSSFITEWIENKHIDDARLISNKVIAKELKLPPVKLHCSMLAEDAVKSAIQDYLKKN